MKVWVITSDSYDDLYDECYSDVFEGVYLSEKAAKKACFDAYNAALIGDESIPRWLGMEDVTRIDSTSSEISWEHRHGYVHLYIQEVEATDIGEVAE